MGRSRGTEPGGRGGLREFLREHGEAVEADLQRFYGIELADVFRGRLTWRRLAVLIRQLPDDAATWRSMRPTDVGWGIQEHLLANVVDLLALQVWQAGGGKGPRPKRVPRPGVEPKKVRLGNASGRTDDEVRALLARFAPQTGGG